MPPLLYVLFATVLVVVTSGKFNGVDLPATGAPGGVIVHLFDWKYDDIANECENFLGPNGYAGVQVSPVTEHMVLRQVKGWDKYVKMIPFNELVTRTKWYQNLATYRPWIERYEPVSYKIHSRSGTENSFKNMVSKCNKSGVKVYVDVVLNHMTRTYPNGAVVGTLGSQIDTKRYSYPDVPYQKEDFNQPTCKINNYNDLKELRVCEHEGLHDLNQTNPCVREKMRNFLNTLISFGVAGFRVDMAQFMHPDDLKKIFRTDYLNTEAGFDAETFPFVYHDIPNSDIGKAVNVEEYYTSGSVMDYSYADDVSSAFSGTKSLADLGKYGPEFSAIKSSQSVVFVDTHMTQRGMTAKNILTHATPRAYRMATAFLLAFPYGEPQIMSSYKFSEVLEGPPTEDGSGIASVKFDSKGCVNGWICEHRWPQISNMVKFRNAVKGERLTHWTVHGPNQISFGRGNKGFVVFNAEKNADFTMTVQTGLPPGVYCDVISGGLAGGVCTGKTITVDGNGKAQFSLLTKDVDGVIAIHQGMSTPLSLTPATNQIARTSANEYNYFTPTKTGEPGGVIVHLFEWRFDDIAKECEQFLGPKGYAGIQVSPVNEYLVVGKRPWWERYQPVSYKIVSRSGDEDEFRNMVQRCNKVGVKIYVDVILNHMTGTSSSDAVGVGGSKADTINFYYPAVPYTRDDFHWPPCSISNYDHPEEARNCELSGLHDLKQDRPSVQAKMVEFLNKLISCGVAGFRVDAAKHMWPSDLQNIFSRVNNLNTSHGFRSEARPFIYQEFAGSGTEGYMKGSEYYQIGYVTDFKYGYELSRAFRKHNPLKYYSTFGESWRLLSSDKALVFIDNHDTQRGSGYGGTEILTHKEPRRYKMAVAFMLAWPFGVQQVMSSYFFDNTDQGPPSNADESIANVQFSGDICTNGWTCEHRWRQIYNMVRFRNYVQGEQVRNWWNNGDYQAAFSRGNKGFIAFNVETEPYNNLDHRLQTGLPAGTYCDVISGNLESGRCTGKTVTVDGDGYAQIQLRTSDEDGVLAIHTSARCN